MKKGWPTKQLSELYKIGSSKRVLQSQWKTEGVPFYRGREVTRLAADGFVDNELFISEKHFAELSKAGDIVITAIGTIGNSHVVRSADRFYFKDASVLRMKRTAEVSSEFVNLWLKSPAFFDQLDRGNGATVDTLTIQKLQSVEIAVPPLAEQQRIVGLLDEAFEGLATAKANAEKNLQNARALFESHLQSVFTQRGPGWLEKRIEEWCDSVMDCVNKTAPVVEEPTPFKMIRTTNVRHGRVDVSTVRYLTEETYKIWTRRQIPQKGDVILTREAPMGEVGMLLTDDKVFLGQRLVSYRADSTKLDNHFLLFALQSGDLQGQIHAKASGSTLQYMRVPDTKNLLLAAPPLAKQRQTVEQLMGLREETQRLARLYERKLAALEALKKSLLHQAFAGEL